VLQELLGGTPPTTVQHQDHILYVLRVFALVALCHHMLSVGSSSGGTALPYTCVHPVPPTSVRDYLPCGICSVERRSAH